MLVRFVFSRDLHRVFGELQVDDDGGHHVVALRVGERREGESGSYAEQSQVDLRGLADWTDAPPIRMSVDSVGAMRAALRPMRSVDTIARLYATSGWPLRKLLLGDPELAGRELIPGRRELLAIVHHEAEAGPTVLRRHARWTLGVVLRGFVAESHGLPHDAGWPPPAALVDPWERQTRKLAEIYLFGSCSSGSSRA